MKQSFESSRPAVFTLHFTGVTKGKNLLAQVENSRNGTYVYNLLHLLFFSVFPTLMSVRKYK